MYKVVNRLILEPRGHWFRFRKRAPGIKSVSLTQKVSYENGWYHESQVSKNEIKRRDKKTFSDHKTRDDHKTSRWIYGWRNRQNTLKFDHRRHGRHITGCSRIQNWPTKPKRASTFKLQNFFAQVGVSMSCSEIIHELSYVSVQMEIIWSF